MFAQKLYLGDKLQPRSQGFSLGDLARQIAKGKALGTRLDKLLKVKTWRQKGTFTKA